MYITSLVIPVPAGNKAVQAKPDEKIVLTWQIWSDKETFEAAEHKMHDDPRMDAIRVGRSRAPLPPTRNSLR